MKTGKYKALIFAVFLFAVLNYSYINANAEIILVKGPQQYKGNGMSNIPADAELNENISDMKSQLLCAQDEIIKLQEANQKLVKSLSESEMKSKLLEKQKLSLEQEIISRVKQLEELSKQTSIKVNNTSSNEINELKNQISVYLKKIEDMSMQLVSLNNELNKVKMEYSSANLKLDNTVNDKDSQISLLKNQLAFSERQIQDFSYKITALNSNLEKTKEVYTSAIARQKELENLVAMANKRADDISCEKMARITELTKELALYKTNNAASVVNKAAVNTEYQKPVAAVSSVIVDNTKSEEDYFNIAKAYQDAKDYKEAINNYKRAIALNASFGRAYKELGLVYAQIGDYNNAGYSLKKCLYYSNNPREREVLRNFISNIERYINAK